MQDNLASVLLHMGLETVHEQNEVDAITNLKSITTLGRPNFGTLFEELAMRHPGSDVGIFFCGPTQLGADIR